MPLRDRERELVQRAAQPFQEQGAPRRIGPQQPDAAFTADEPQGRYLVLRLITRARDKQLQNRWRAIAQRGLGDERFRRVLIRSACSK